MKLSKLTRDDVPRMMFWGKHYDPRFFHYNFDLTTEHGFDMWYRSKKKLFYKKIYKVEVHQKMVGFITIKNIKWSTRTAEMGIVFDPNELSKGYGTQGMRLILKEFFEVLKMQKLYLRVASFNKRAQTSYIKAGFKEDVRKDEPFESQMIKDVILKQFDSFYMVDDTLYTNYIYMSINKEGYLATKK